MDVIVTTALVLALWLPALPPLRLLLAKGFRRRLALFPTRRGQYVIGLSTYLALCVAVVLALPVIAPAAAALSVAAFACVYGWRARESYGSRRGLPPGKLLPAGAGPWQDPEWSRVRFERYGHIFKTCHVLQPMICIGHLAVARRLLRAHGSSLVTPPMPFNSNIPGGFMRYLEPGTYDEFRQVFGAVFSSTGVLARREGTVQETFRRHLLAANLDGSVADPAPSIEDSLFDVVLLLFLGLTRDDPRHARCKSLLRRLDYRRTVLLGNRRARKLLVEFQQQIESMAEPTASYLGVMRRRPPARIMVDDATLWGNFIYLMITSAIDLADLMLWILYDLAKNPAWIERLRDGEPNEAAHRPERLRLPTRIVMESLRLHQSEYIMRRACSEIRFEGFTIPRNWLVRVDVRAAHRDPELFDRPERFDPDRFLRDASPAARYCPLGIPPAPCLGRGLTHWTGEQFIEAVVRPSHISSVGDGKHELGVFHWRPASTWRPVIEPATVSRASSDRWGQPWMPESTGRVQSHGHRAFPR